MTEPQSQQQKTKITSSTSPRIPWFWLVIPFLALLLVLALRQGDYRPQTATWSDNLDDALEQARQTGKTVLVAFSASWCGPCQHMKKNVYPDPKVQAALAAMIPVLIDVDHHPDLAQQYNVTAIPTYYVLAPDGQLIVTASGTLPPDEFADWLLKAAAHNN